MGAKCREVDFIAKRYGSLPHEIAGLTYEDYVFDLTVVLSAQRQENDDIKAANRKHEQSRR